MACRTVTPEKIQPAKNVGQKGGLQVNQFRWTACNLLA